VNITRKKERMITLEYILNRRVNDAPAQAARWVDWRCGCAPK